MNRILPPITSNFDALVRALVLGVIAPTEEKSDSALAIAEYFAALLPAEDVAKARQTAEAILASNS